MHKDTRMFRIRFRILIGLLLIGLALIATPVWAHQPFFEETDIPPDRPWRIDDPSVSTAIYATLESATDVDVFAFDGRAGQAVYLSIVIPQIPGQENFAPTMALIGPGLPGEATALPAAVPVADEGVEMIPPPEGTPSTFFEPFTRTSYWERQERTVVLPADSLYRVAVWHPDEAGNLTPRGQAIIAHTPMGRFGEPDDLVGTIIWLASPASAFVTGAVIPIDGGFSAFAGV
jgi:Dehydrogenases with different specificities (related to short-chain alcohol dehydrogenases)